MLYLNLQKDFFKSFCIPKPLVQFSLVETFYRHAWRPSSTAPGTIFWTSLVQNKIFKGSAAATYALFHIFLFPEQIVPTILISRKMTTPNKQSAERVGDNRKSLQTTISQEQYVRNYRVAYDSVMRHFIFAPTSMEPCAIVVTWFDHARQIDKGIRFA